MRRTTIYRSELTSLAALLALAAAPLGAQVSAPNITRPINAARGAASATNQNTAAQQAPGSEQQPASSSNSRVQLGEPGANGASGAAQGTVQNPGTHVVQQGETLWALAQQFLGDPMLWPEIYRLNTNVVEDPHWIYPGEELRLSSAQAPTADTTVVVQQQNLTVTPTADTVRQVAATPVAYGPTIFNSPSARVRGGSSIEVMNDRAYRAVREGEYFSSGFLTENEPLNSGRIVSTSAEMRDIARNRTTAQLYERITIQPPTGETIAAGDLLLVFKRGDETEAFGQIVIPTGLVRALGPAGENNNLVSARVVSLYGQLEKDQELIRVQPFVNNSNVRALAVTNGVEGHVIRMRDRRNVAQPLDVLFIDQGANAGVRPGDIVQIYVTRPDAEHGGSLEQDQGRAIIVSTRSRTATAVIVDLYRGDVGAQSQVRLIRRMPS
jgi:LysM repeat protein